MNLYEASVKGLFMLDSYPQATYIPRALKWVILIHIGRGFNG